jgi:hypothetical protein
MTDLILANAKDLEKIVLIARVPGELTVAVAAFRSKSRSTCR